MTSRFLRLAPRASTLIESLRDVGYSLPTAIADIIDNSITADARNIHLFSSVDAVNPAIGILDDGRGMDKEELFDAMRLGSSHPKKSRELSDLGRFGLGLKTASFSQCRRLTVVSKKNDVTTCAIWDLDAIARQDNWLLETPGHYDAVPWTDNLKYSGTLVVWENLDRLLDKESGFDIKHFNRLINDTADHIELVFHRFLSGHVEGRSKINIFLNYCKLEPFDPFNSGHPATQRDPKEYYRYREEEIHIESFTLPHHSKVSKNDWEKYARKEGYVKNQGFYLYRNSRLIIHGTWFGLAKQTEATKLCRVQIDISNKLDAYWKIDIKKASAQIPPTIREKLQSLIERIGVTSKKVYRGKGGRIAENPMIQIWQRRQNKNQFHYCLNDQHPKLQEFVFELSDQQAKRFLDLLRLIETTLPIDTLFGDVSNDPHSIVQRALSAEYFFDCIKTTYSELSDQGVEKDRILEMMKSVEPFSSSWEETKSQIDNLLIKGSVTDDCQ